MFQYCFLSCCSHLNVVGHPQLKTCTMKGLGYSQIFAVLLIIMNSNLCDKNNDDYTIEFICILYGKKCLQKMPPEDAERMANSRNRVMILFAYNTQLFSRSF